MLHVSVNDPLIVDIFSVALSFLFSFSPFDCSIFYLQIKTYNYILNVGEPTKKKKPRLRQQFDALQ